MVVVSNVWYEYRFGERGDITSNTDADHNDAVKEQTNSPLVLQIKESQAEFFRFEPVELDITLSCSKTRGIRIPDEIDPGYDRFKIWITTPNGVSVRPSQLSASEPNPTARRPTFTSPQS